MSDTFAERGDFPFKYHPGGPRPAGGHGCEGVWTSWMNHPGESGDSSPRGGWSHGRTPRQYPPLLRERGSGWLPIAAPIRTRSGTRRACLNGTELAALSAVNIPSLFGSESSHLLQSGLPEVRQSARLATMSQPRLRPFKAKHAGNVPLQRVRRNAGRRSRAKPHPEGGRPCRRSRTTVRTCG